MKMLISYVYVLILKLNHNTTALKQHEILHSDLVFIELYVYVAGPIVKGVRLQ